jgi:predicted ATPase
MTLRNFLSFGPDTETLLLQTLNVFIGPNGSGKSNVIEAVSVMRSTPRDLRQTLLRGGGVGEWIWKGSETRPATIDVVVSHQPSPLRHKLAFRAEGQEFRLVDERVENDRPYKGRPDVFFYYRLQDGRPVVNVAGEERRLQRESVDINESILAQRRDPDTYPEITFLGHVYDEIRIYQEWAFGHRAVFREPQKADMRNDRLAEDFSNLGLFLNRLRGKPKAKRVLLDRLRDLYEGLSDFDVSVKGGSVQVFFTEGDFTIPATRL